MALFKKKNTGDNAIPEDLRPYYSKERGVGRWLGPILRAAALLVIVGLLVWGGIWAVGKIVNRDTSNGKPVATKQAEQKSNSAQHQDKSKSEPSPKPGSDSKAPSASKPDGQSVPAAPTTPTAPNASGGGGAQQPSANADALANTGPGEVLAVSVATFVAATVGFHLYQMRRRSLQR